MTREFVVGEIVEALFAPVLARFPTAEEIAELERLSSAAFRAPWTYAEWEVECGNHESFGDCANPECDGAHVPCTTIEAPKEYPGGQVVAQIQVPGLQTLADRNGEFIAKSRNALPSLLAAASFALKCEAFLREHGSSILSVVAAVRKESGARDPDSDEDAMGELLRSLPRKEGA